MDFNLEEGLSDRSTLNTHRRDQDPTCLPLIWEQEQEDFVQDLRNHDQNQHGQDEAELNLDLNLPIQGGVEPNQGGVEPIQGHIVLIQDEVEPVMEESRLPFHFSLRTLL